MELQNTQNHVTKIGFIKESRIVEILSQFIFPREIERGIIKFSRKYPVKNEATFINFCKLIKDIFGTRLSDVNKLSSLNYIFDLNQSDIYHSLGMNLDFLVDAFGKNIFLKKDKNKLQWKELSSESNIFLTLNGGAGAGTFSIDLTIGGLNPQKTGINPLIHVTFDTVMIGNKRVGRIIRLGRVVKPGEEAKVEMLSNYMKEFKGSPESYLIQCAIRILADLGITEFMGLSTNGAYSLSSLGKSKSGFDYSRLFSSAGFKQSANDNWFGLEFPDGNWYKYFATQTTRYINTPLVNHFDCCDELPEIKKLALQNIQTRTRNKISLLIAGSIIAGKFGWNISDL